MILQATKIFTVTFPMFLFPRQIHQLFDASSFPLTFPGDTILSGEKIRKNYLVCQWNNWVIISIQVSSPD